jgi:hypothetical protein
MESMSGGEELTMQSSVKRSAYFVAWTLALLLVGIASVYKFYVLHPPETPREIPKLGALGGTHAHASFLLMVGKEAVDFCDPKYMLKSKVAHFENNKFFVVHKHATGVTLPTFLNTIGVILSARCVEIPSVGTFCNEGERALRAVVNGAEVEISELPFYELRNNDHILLNYGPEKGADLRFKYNQVPMIPLDVNEPGQ